MGSLSLIVVLIIVVWVIVLAPMMMGNNKPIRRSGEGYDETRVLHAGGSAPVEGRRRPRLTRADVHRFSSDDADYEVVEAEEPGEELLLAPAEPADEQEDTVDGEVVDTPEEGGSTAYSVLKETELKETEPAETETEDAEDDDPYELDETYESPADYGYAESTEAAADEVESDRPEQSLPSNTEGDQEDQEDQEADLTEEEIAFATSRRGRGGWDPEREKASRADRFQRRQRTLLGLIVADVVAFVAAFVVGGWMWVAPALTIALTVWFMVVLRSVVRQERALHARRVRQLRRARMGVVTSTSEELGHVRRRPGAVIVERDDESPDFDSLPSYRAEPVASGPVLRAS